MRLYGKNPVIERLKSNPRSIRKILVQEGSSDAGYIRKKAQKWGIPMAVIPRSKMIKMSQHINAQGVLADIEEFPYAGFNELLEQVYKKRATIIFLDNLNDPQNLGAIIRSVGCLGGFALVLPTHKSVDVTPAVLRVASGADNHVPIAKVSNLNVAIKTAKEAGFQIVGSDVEGGRSLFETEFSFPLGLIVGSEHKGIREVTRKHLELRVTIPMAQPRLSYNVAQATTILCYEITRQKQQAKS